MRVLMVQGTTSWAGGEAVARAVAAGSPAIEATFFVPGALDVATRERYAPFPVREAPAGDLRSVVRALRAATREVQPDLVHAHGTRAKLLAWLAFLHSSRRPRFVYTVHGFHILHRPFLRRQAAFLFERISNLWVDEVITTNNADRDAVVASGTAPAAKVRAVYNGIDAEKFASGSREAGRAFVGASAGTFLVLSVARMHPQKDIPTLLAAWQRVAREVPGALLVLSGDGPLQGEMEKLAGELGVLEGVRFLGYVENGPDLLAACDVVALITHWEGMALVPLEAGAASRPIVGTDVPGMAETVRDGKNGFLVKHGDAGNVARKLVELASDPALRERMGEAGRRMVQEEFTEQKMAAAYLARYAAVLGRAR